MAITQLGVIVTGVRGTIGGITFSANKSGTHAKIKSKPSNPMTVKQVEQRGYLSTMGSLWRSLSTAQQEDWNTFAATPPETDYNSLGEVYLLSGFGWFCRICLRRLRTGQAQSLLAPANVPVSPPDTFTLALYQTFGNPDEAVVSYTENDFLDHYLILELAYAPGTGSNVRTSRFLMCWEDEPLTSTATEFGEEFYAAFGKTQLGQRYFARLYKQSSSAIRSTPLELFTGIVSGP